MWAGSYVVVLTVGGLVLMLIALAVTLGAPILAIPIVVVGVAVLAYVDFTRRRRQVREMQTFREQAKTEKVEFTPRDKETLVSE
jgi:Flp pilus assembly protein TadB